MTDEDVIQIITVITYLHQRKAYLSEVDLNVIAQYLEALEHIQRKLRGYKIPA